MKLLQTKTMYCKAKFWLWMIYVYLMQLLLFSVSCFQVSLDGFRAKRFNCLVATDVAGRGIDIPVCSCSSSKFRVVHTLLWRFFVSELDKIRYGFKMPWHCLNVQIPNFDDGWMCKGPFCTFHGLMMMNTLSTLNVVNVNTQYSLCILLASIEQN